MQQQYTSTRFQDTDHVLCQMIKMLINSKTYLLKGTQYFQPKIMLYHSDAEKYKHILYQFSMFRGY